MHGLKTKQHKLEWLWFPSRDTLPNEETIESVKQIYSHQIHVHVVPFLHREHLGFVGSSI